MALGTVAERLEEAQIALHKLLTGINEVSLRYAETSVTYNQANIAELRLYIAELQGLSDTTKTRRPMSVRAW